MRMMQSDQDTMSSDDMRALDSKGYQAGKGAGKQGLDG